ncbi:ABC transporter ATP-binding protein [Rhizobium sp. R693]|uniref:ABC transporter ATP-binding protein n=1 Tax=Rhizobium sp. R693 TaxID=1764276 RepID=UPI000B52B7A4|nr:ABC transporter ATP-binding protein [Rhizobium sp. R693]OWV83272.1 ABC transporter ATP-binding protein [Rhizobium sp. R693]
MSSEVALKVENLSKAYQIYDKPRDRLLQMVAGGRKQYFKDFWALKDVSFEIGKGETIGIVGRNGSGKSTLLQMICGTLNPTGGTVLASGRIAALLELGSGFNPEFSGRENVYLNAAVLGLTRQETDRRFDSILSFSEIGDFIEQPVKTYSSGMLVRLAFSVAINVDPQILIVDEALSVGDELFQRKCFSRIEAIKKTGATILFVSHSAAAVVDLCDRAFLLDSGELLSIGAPKEIVGKYQRLLYAPETLRGEIREHMQKAGVSLDEADSPNTVLQLHENQDDLPEAFDPDLKPTSTIEYAPNGASINSTQICSLAGQRLNNLKRGRRYKYSYRVTFDRAATNVRFGMLIKTITGFEIGGAHSANKTSAGIPFVRAGEVYDVEFQFDCRLNPGIYFLNSGVTGVVDQVDVQLHRLLDIDMFRVLPDSSNLSTSVVDFGCLPKVECVS